MTPARDKDPIFEIRGSEDKVKEAETKLLMYIALRTGSMFDDTDHSIDIDLKKPMLPPKQKESYFGLTSSLPTSPTKPWFKSDPYSMTTNSTLNALVSPTSFPYDAHQQQIIKSRLDAMARASIDSGYNSPNTDPSDLLHKLLEQVQMNFSQSQYQQSAQGHGQSDPWSLSTNWSTYHDTTTK